MLRSILAGAGLGLVLFGACTPERPACSAQTLAAIEVAYINEAIAHCTGETFSECKALPGIRDKYRAKRAEWERCK